MVLHRNRSAALLSPRVRRAGRTRTPQSVLCWALILLAVGLVGFMQLSRFEARMHAALHRHRKSDGDSSSSSGGGDQQQPGLVNSHGQGQQSSSQACIATLEAAGMLADSEGRRLTAEQRQRRLQERRPRMWRRKTAEQLAKEAAEDAAATIAAEALAAQQARRKLYDGMEQSLRDRGLALATSNTQGMALGDMFKIEGGRLRPVVTVLPIPVRAIVMPLSDIQAALRLEDAVQRHLDPLMPPNGIWKQHHRLYHSTIFHASTHMDPVRAAPRDVDMEEYLIKDVGHKACPLHLTLERIVATPSGTVLACWQIMNGTDVLDIRNWLEEILPHHSKQQVVQDRTILHTTLARLVAPPKLDGLAAAATDGGQGGGGAAADAARVLQAAADRMTTDLCGLRTVIDKMWFVEEYEKLALALRGTFRQREVPMECEPLYQRYRRHRQLRPA